MVGSRLAVKKAFRRQGVLGASLIRLAVSSANTLGCHTFLATVQEQNEVLFKRLHWATTGYQEFHGMKHAKMQADLEHYPPLSQPSLGFWVSGRPVKDTEISPYLLGLEPNLIKFDCTHGVGRRSMLQQLIETVRHYPGVASKVALAPVISSFEKRNQSGFSNGDDTAVLKNANGYDLFAIEGFLPDFVAAGSLVCRLVWRHG